MGYRLIPWLCMSMVLCGGRSYCYDNTPSPVDNETRIYSKIIAGGVISGVIVANLLSRYTNIADNASSCRNGNTGGSENAQHIASGKNLRGDARDEANLWDYEDLPQELQTIVMHHARPDLAQAYGFTAPNWLILYGPPGTGKTTMAKSVASLLGGYQETLAASDVLSRWVGATEQTVRDTLHRLVTSARACPERRACLIIDECEFLFPSQETSGGGMSDVSRNVVATFHDFLENEVPQDVTIHVIGTTNRLESIEASTRRDGRCTKVHINGVTQAQRAKVMQKQLSSVEQNVLDFSNDIFRDQNSQIRAQLLSAASGLNPAEISAVIDEVRRHAFQQACANATVCRITVSDLVNAFLARQRNNTVHA